MSNISIHHLSKMLSLIGKQNQITSTMDKITLFFGNRNNRGEYEITTEKHV